MARVGGEEIDLTPTDGMAKEAQKALDWRKGGGSSKSIIAANARRTASDS